MIIYFLFFTVKENTGSEPVCCCAGLLEKGGLADPAAGGGGSPWLPAAPGTGVSGQARVFGRVCAACSMVHLLA